MTITILNKIDNIIPNLYTLNKKYKIIHAANKHNLCIDKVKKEDILGVIFIADNNKTRIAISLSGVNVIINN